MLQLPSPTHRTTPSVHSTTRLSRFSVTSAARSLQQMLRTMCDPSYVKLMENSAQLSLLAIVSRLCQKWNSVSPMMSEIVQLLPWTKKKNHAVDAYNQNLVISRNHVRSLIQLRNRERTRLATAATSRIDALQRNQAADSSISHDASPGWFFFFFFLTRVVETHCIICLGTKENWSLAYA